MSDINGKVVLITGAAKRIGRAIALDMAAAGYQVAVHYNKSVEDAHKLAAEICAAGGVAKLFAADLECEEETYQLISKVVEQLGNVDVLINNASIFEDEEWDQVTRHSWDRHLNINLRAPFVLMQEMAKALPEDRDGAIINVIDQRVLNLTPHFVSYTLAKSGLWTLTQTMAQALAPHIRVNAIGPGPTLPSERQKDEDFAAQSQNIPLQKQVSLSDICSAVRYLCTANSVTGQLLTVDGGEHLGWAQPAYGFIPNE